MHHSPATTPGHEHDDELFAAFANTLARNRRHAADEIGDADALLAWLHRHGLISDRARAAEAGRLHRDPAETARRLQRFAHLRDVLRETVTDVIQDGEPTAGRLRDLNHILRHGLHYHQLERSPSTARFSFAQVGDRLDQARATIASSLAQYLAQEPADRLRICANDTCRWIFVDRSPAGRRRWCDMRTCGNQAKVARHRARARAGQGVPAAGMPD